MQKLIYTNSLGESVELSNRPPFVLSKPDGLGDVEANVQRQKSPYQDGTTYVDSLLKERFISFQVSIIGKSREDVSALREQLARVFNPKLAGLIVYDNGRVRRHIQAYSEHVPKYPSGERKGRTQVSLISLVCPNPYWSEENPINIKLEDFVANFSFPFSFPVSFSIRGDSKLLVNSGHVPTPVKITFRGEAINPKVTKNTTGEFIRINRPIPEGHSLVITTGFNDKAVRIVDLNGVETNAMGYIDLNSTFFSLDVGDNQLSFITDGGQPEVFIEYKNLYLGV